MANLKILGAQRVKALTEILNKQRDEEIRKVRSCSLTSEEKKAKTLKHLGVDGIYEDIMRKKSEIEELSAQYKSRTGYYFKVSENYDYRDENHREFDKYMNRLDDPIHEEIAEISREYSEKANSLWLCETLEEAKEIVGIE